MQLDETDYKLSMALAPRGKHDDTIPMRSLLVHRLSDTVKGVMRRGLRRNHTSFYCEPCKQWTERNISDFQIGDRWTCRWCRRLYRMELIVFEEIEPSAPADAPDTNAEWWMTLDVARYTGVEPRTISSYSGRGQMPAPDQRFGRTPVWKPETIIAWHKDRPRRD